MIGLLITLGAIVALAFFLMSRHENTSLKSSSPAPVASESVMNALATPAQQGVGCTTTDSTSCRVDSPSPSH
jgi:hypothetical protein